MYEAVTGTRIKSIPPEVMERLNEPLPRAVDRHLQPHRRRRGLAVVHRAEAPTTDNMEVQGSHMGLLHNPTVLYVIADRLAEPEGSMRPFEPSGWLRLVAQHGPDRDDSRRHA